MSYSTPILFLIFNRPDVTQLVFERIRQQQPQQLYIAADGPRTQKTAEAEKCTQARQLVLSGIDWPCEVKTLFRDKNLGCGKAVSEAITWFFGQVEEGIILEDDCLPNESFFYFSESLLAKYRHNNQIMHIGGSNFQKKDIKLNNSYYFSNYIHVWGWATWRRAWALYQYNVPHNFDTSFLTILKKKFTDKFERNYWLKSFGDMAEHRIDTWDIQWVYSIYKHNGVGITPAVNMISNIGFRADATHTHTFDPNSAAIPLQSIHYIVHPPSIRVLQKADRYTYKKLFQFGNTWFNRVKFKTGKMLPLVKFIYLKISGKK